MATQRDRQFPIGVMQELCTNHELLFREEARPKPPPSGTMRVGIVGGGTAGWMAALALRARAPWAEVTVIESSKIPIIGVGEATVPSLVAFLHRYLDLDIHELYREVKPTWKQGIRFEWGLPEPYVFQAPFDWDANGVGMLGAMAEQGNVSDFTLQGVLMARDVTTVFKTGSSLQSYLPLLPFAYHLDNPRFVGFLTRTALARGVRRIDCQIVDAEMGEPDASGDPQIAALVTDDGQRLSFDLYLDCSGFRSLLLEQKLGAKFESYASSLFTDRALAFNVPHGGKLNAYTTARTMQSGWCWNIPIPEDDHKGYVFSSSHCSEEAALAEARALWPSMSNERVVRFRSGRHERPWVGNVYALGNAFAFVEPLESTGLLMIMRSITSLVRALPIEPDNQVMKRFVNTTVTRDWDRLRWFLSAHYKFNRRLDSPFWREVREKVDIAGIAEAVELFQACGPLSLLPRAVRPSVIERANIFFYGLAGLDCILLGQQVPHRPIEREPSSSFRSRHETAVAFARQALSQAEALDAVGQYPAWLDQLVLHPQSWVRQMEAYL